ncbi:MAG: NAD(P)-dependent oxidoreductase [Acidobacteria bacterium]|nr:NAD(P)-dependent oxidoreductase [Acidobacteriota bacterium]
MTTSAEPVGFIGLGRMGQPMARNLLKRGFSLIVHNRSRTAVEVLAELGAETAEMPAEVARRARTLITMLPDGPDVEQVFAAERGVFSALEPGTLLIDMSTIAPATTRVLAARAAEAGATLLDAPVSGGEIGAVDATLSIMVGGDRHAFDRARPLFEAMGNPERIRYLGPSGAGQICKACNQLVIGGTLAAVGEAFALARKAGVDPAVVREALLGGFAASRVLDVHGERVLAGRFTPGFRTALFAKDLRIATDALGASGVPAPVTALVQQLVTTLIASGGGDEDYSSLGTLASRLAGLPT